MFLALLGACCFMWLQNKSDCIGWADQMENLKKSMMSLLIYFEYTHSSNSSSVPHKGPRINSLIHPVTGILNIGSSKVFSNIYVPYGSTENCCHANRPANIYFQQAECISPLLILPKAFFILLTFYLCKLTIRKQDSND